MLRISACFALWFIAACSPSSDVSRELGARCDVKEDCDETCLPNSRMYPGGFCSVSCLADSDCPDGAACEPVIPGGACLFACTGQEDCDFLGEGWICRPAIEAGEVRVCIGQ